MSNNPIYRKTKRYTKQLATKIFTLDDARNIVIKIKKLEGLAPNTIEQYEKLFNDLDRYFGDKTDIASLTSDDIRNFTYWQLNEKEQFKYHKYRKNKKKGVSISTVNTYLAYGKAAFEVLVEEEIVEENIFSSQNNIKQPERKIETLTPKEIEKFLRSLDKSWYTHFRMYVLVHVLLDSFGRIEEVLSLRKSDVDVERHCVTFNNTKSGAMRIVPITKKSVSLIEELFEENEDFTDIDYLFLTHHGKPLKPDTARKHLRELSELVGLNKLTGFHIFRHTASEMFLRQNGSIKVLQKILGHADLSTTSVWYSHILDDTVIQQHNQFSPLNLIEEKEKRKTRRKKK